jgi:glycerophosphoryl diester phosphodiesterase
MRLFVALLFLFGAAGIAAAAIVPTGAPTAPFLVIAHRGASGVLPEHTLEAYRRAIDQGADFVEPDLVPTRDGHLVARHERQLGRTTDVSRRPEFAARRVIKPGNAEPDWYVEDFTLAEIRTLRARQPVPGRPDGYDDRFGVATFEDILVLVRERSAALGRPVGVWAELKHPAQFAGMGLDVTAPLLRGFARHGFGTSQRPAVIQSFDADVLRQLDKRTSIPLIVLLSDPASSLDDVAGFAAGIGAAKHLLIDPASGRGTPFLRRARALGLKVVPWTFRDDAPGQGFASADAEMQAYLELGVDGVITDFPDTAVALRHHH